MKNNVNNKNIIKGLLKEALFLDLEAKIEFGHAEMHGRLVELTDNESEAILLHLDLDEASPNEVPQSVSISIFFKNFMAKFTAHVGFLRNPFLMLALPSEINLSNERSEIRHLLSEDVSLWTRVSLINEDGVTTARFRPTNLSQNGMGGELSYTSEYNLKPGTVISGDHWFNGQWVKINGEIRSVRQLSKLHDQSTFCIIGIENKKPKRREERATRARRSPSKTHIDLSFLALPLKSFKIEIKNVSVSGFLAIITDTTLQDFAIMSKHAQKTNTSMCAQLVSYEMNEFRFQWISGNESDRLSWLKEIAPFSADDIDALSLRKDDILSLFCQSGALSNQYIREQKQLSKELLTSLERGSLSEPWIYRLTNRTPEGKAKGYASCMKSGDNAWSLIDLVSDRHGDKISKDFVPKFFTSFMEFSLSLVPCPLHFCGWVSEHPFFFKFEEFLNGEAKHLKLQQSDMFYTRLNAQHLVKSNPSVKCIKITSRDYTEITNLQEKLNDYDLDLFSESMDFSTQSFSSPQLQKMFQEASLPFKREYWQLKFESFNYLVVLSLFPEGQNPGRWVDSIYVFDLNNIQAPNESWDIIESEIVRLAASQGFSTHAIRRLSMLNCHSAYKREVVKLKASILHPEAWKFYYGD